MNIIPLTNDDFNSYFQLVRYTGLVLVYFKQQNCPGCVAFDKLFLEISQRFDYDLHDIIFSVCNLDIQRMVINKSKSKSRNDKPLIDKVPTLMIFFERNLIANYKGPLTFEHVIDFIQDVCVNHVSNIAQQSSTIQQVAPVAESIYSSYQKQIPPFSPFQITPPQHFSSLKSNTNSGNRLYDDDGYVTSWNTWNYLIPYDSPWMQLKTTH